MVRVLRMFWGHKSASMSLLLTGSGIFLQLGIILDRLYPFWKLCRIYISPYVSNWNSKIGKPSRKSFFYDISSSKWLRSNSWQLQPILSSMQDRLRQGCLSWSNSLRNPRYSSKTYLRFYYLLQCISWPLARLIRILRIE